MALLNIRNKKNQTIQTQSEAFVEIAPDILAISFQAAEQIRRALAPGTWMRVALQGGGCSGVKPYFSQEASLKETDRVFTEHGVSICIDPKSFQILGGSWLDFDNGFKIRSSRLKKTCSCGESFSLTLTSSYLPKLH